MIANADSTSGFIPFAIGGFIAPQPSDYFLELNGTNYATLATTWIPSTQPGIRVNFRVDEITTETQTLVAGDTTINNEVVIEILPTGYIRAFFYDDLVLKGELTSLAPILPNIIYDVSYSYSSGTAYLHLDDAEQDSVVVAINGSPNLGYVGRRPDNANAFIGVIHELELTGGNAVSWIINSQSLTREPSEEFPGNPLKDLIYTNVVADDWNRFIPLQADGEYVTADGVQIYVLEH